MTTKVKLILAGVHENEYLDDGSYWINSLTSSVILAQAEEKNILIDTGTPNFMPQILANLKAERLKPEEIDYLVLTHHHLDHVFNAHFFPKALIYTSKAFWHWQETRCHIFPQGVEEDIIPGIKIIPTPGHSPDSLSVFAEDFTGKKWVMAGDAINIHYLDNGSLRERIGEEGIRSIQKILDFNPDFIIPGHGEILKSAEIQRVRGFMARLE